MGLHDRSHTGDTLPHMNKTTALEIIFSMLNRVTFSPAEKVGVQAAIRTLDQTVKNYDIIESELNSLKQEKVKAAPQKEAPPSESNVTIDPTPAAEPQSSSTPTQA